MNIFFLIQHDERNIRLEFVDICSFVFSKQEFQMQHFVEQFELIQLITKFTRKSIFIIKKKLRTEINRILFIIWNNGFPILNKKKWTNDSYVVMNTFQTYFYFLFLFLLIFQQFLNNKNNPNLEKRWSFSISNQMKWITWWSK
jgi:hypothetical protein